MGSAEGDLSSLLLHALCDASPQDPDLAAAIAERRTVGKYGKTFCARPKAVSAVQPESHTRAKSSGGGPTEEHDRAYFVLLTKISQLEAANLCLEKQVACTKEDATRYQGVALELEQDLHAVVAENSLNIAAIAKLKLESAATAVRLVCAEETIAQLRAQLEVSPLAETNACDIEQDLIRLHALATAVQSSQACPASAPTRKRNRKIDASATIVTTSALPANLAYVALPEQLEAMEDSKHVRARVTLADIVWRATELSADCLLSRAVCRRNVADDAAPNARVMLRSA